MLVSDFPISNRTKNAFIAKGFYSEEDFRDKFVEDLKDIDGIGAKGITEVREYLHSKFGITFRHKPKPKKINNPKECGTVVKHFLGHKSFIAWAKEMVTAKTLLTRYDLDTLLSVKPNYRASSLVFYLCEDGQKYIRSYLPTISVEEQEPEVKEQESELQFEEVTLNTSIFVAPPKSIKDFIK